MNVRHSILWNNATGDMSNVACGSAHWSDIGIPDCTGVQNNIPWSPVFVAL